MGQEVSFPQNFELAPQFAAVPVDNDLGEGISGSFAVLAYPGKVWTLKYKGVETPFWIDPEDETKGTVQSVEVIIVKSAKHLSKLFYAGGWVKGSTARPDCYSSNGVIPDASVSQPVSHTCALCPNNAFGSAPGTGKGKACSDDKRLAIVPLEDPENDYYNGPMLLRIPADSLQPMEEYSGRLKKAGAPYYAIATRIRFDPTKEHQRLLMSPIRALTREEAEIVLALREDPRTSRILNSVEDGTVTSESNPEPFFEQAEAQAPAPQPPPRRPAQPPVQPAPGARQPTTQNAGAATTQNPPAQAPRPPVATTPPPAQPRPPQQAPKPAQAPPTAASAQTPKPTGGFVARAPGTATQPSPVPQQRAAGGFARPANPPAPQAPQVRAAPTTIAAALAQPAPRPPTQRVVQQAPVVRQPTHGSPELDADAAKLVAMGQDPGPVDDLDEYGNPVGTVYAEDDGSGGVANFDQLEQEALPDGLDEKLNALLGV